MTLCFSGLPVSLKYCLATFQALSTGAPPPGVTAAPAAAGGEEDPVQVAGSQVREPLGQLDRLGVRIGPQREEREVLGLLGGRLGELLTAVAGLHDEQAGEAVEVPLALVVVDVGAFAAD